MKGKTIFLRLFEPEDFEKTYQWHNDFDVQKMTCGPIRFVSKELEKKWVYEKATNNTKDIYLAICLIETEEMIGYISLNDIDMLNRSIRGGGIVIDKKYQDGQAWFEAGDLARQYAFDTLNMNRYTASCMAEHKASRMIVEACGYTLEGIRREAVYKNGQYHDVCCYSLLRSEYYKFREKGFYTFSNFLKTIRQINKNKQK